VEGSRAHRYRQSNAIVMKKSPEVHSTTPNATKQCDERTEKKFINLELTPLRVHSTLNPSFPDVSF
jgi:hypothetical protein